MGAEAQVEVNGPTIAAGGTADADRKGTDGAEKVSTASKPVEGEDLRTASNAAPKPVGREKLLNAVLTDEDIESTLAAASEKLQAAHKRDQKVQKKKGGGFLRALYPKRFLAKFRDLYVNSCITAAEKGDFAELAGHPGVTYGESVIMSRNVSQRRDHEYSEMLQASLSRQVSVSLSRQMSQQGSMNIPTGTSGMTRNGSRGITGLHRNASTGMPGLNRQTSGGITSLNRNTSTGIIGLNRHNGGRAFVKSTSSRKTAESNLFSGGRDKFLQERAAELSKGGPVNSNQNSKVASAPEADKSGKVEAPVGETVQAGEAARPLQ